MHWVASAIITFAMLALVASCSDKPKPKIQADELAPSFLDVWGRLEVACEPPSEANQTVSSDEAVRSASDAEFEFDNPTAELVAILEPEMIRRYPEESVGEPSNRLSAGPVYLVHEEQLQSGNNLGIVIDAETAEVLTLLAVDADSVAEIQPC